MSLFYRLTHRLGFAPWERIARHPPARAAIERALVREEAGREPPFGAALDLGCGRGTWSVELAARGWSVTGVDLSRHALAVARRRAASTGVVARFVAFDLERLDDEAGREVAGLSHGFRLFWDFGTLHDLAGSALRRAAEGIAALAGDEAALLAFAWPHAFRGPLPRGLEPDELLALLPGWKLDAVEPFPAIGLPRPFVRAVPRLVRLRR